MKQAKVQTVSELVINQLTEKQYLEEKQAGRIKEDEVYACTPSPIEWSDIVGKPDLNGSTGGSGGSVDFAELARRIPSWQWKVTMPKTANQTVTATVGGETYTETFYAPGGTSVAFSVKADPGYIAGTLSFAAAVVHDDMTVTVTDATESEEIEAGRRTVTDSSVPETVPVPPKVHVLKMTANGTSKFVRVAPHGELEFQANSAPPLIYPNVPDDPDVPDFGWCPSLVYLLPGAYPHNVFEKVFGFSIVTGGVLIEWSKEINEHAVDFDLTK